MGRADHEVFEVEETVTSLTPCHSFENHARTTDFFVVNRRFRRAFLLIDARHGLKQNDILLLRQFGHEGISFQIVLSKIDRVKPEDIAKLFEFVRHFMHTGIGGMNAGLGEILATSAAPIRKGEKKVGMSELRWAIMVACGLENVRLGGSRNAKIGLEEQIEGSPEENQYLTEN